MRTLLKALGPQPPFEWVFNTHQNHNVSGLISVEGLLGVRPLLVPTFPVCISTAKKGKNVTKPILKK